MSRGCRTRANGARESGYAYMLSLFMIVAVIVTSQAVLHNLATEGKREREQEMIWRGNQYVRGIRMYYRKMGHYPQSLDDLKKGLPSLHFLRPEVEKDPMNKTDGQWRVIYVNAAGQIIGSVKYASLQQMAFLDLNHGKMPGAPQANAGGESNSATAPDGNGQQANSQQNAQSPQPPQGNGAFSPNSPGMGGLQPVQALGAGGALALFANAAAQLQQPTGPVDGPVLGAFVAGVGGYDDRPSLQVYKGGKTYQQWEFIWNPLEDQARALQNGLAPGGLPGGPNGLGMPVANPGGFGPSLAPTTPPYGGQYPPGPGPVTPSAPDQPLVQ
ncbi:MAG TPA: hypothetical protein VEJ46_10650 [Candidatus Acidoferrum sp.]|nr:hypothetical protein [Candidatus Acidoferrum sp.]